MKIGQNPEIANALSQATSAKQQAKTPAPAVETATTQAASAFAAGVPVTFSSSAKALEQTGRNAGEFDANKVKAVKASIEKGTFTIDADAIADKLLSNAQEVLSRSGK
ncbi:flagellar biosynthesis anti-sigma factor FlgM [Paracidovorax wautersii]|uniref:Negative regulator of flagellin synthesis n=1 Tax=Paracidovorax wautersii TaxID=1177982 RepID=A0ABU1IBC8_9BURK|nr:flagellar biosynthesis anti-sigma factor FlgM [Paracidovorax wautersii]MDR6214097.1 negative regulator of flagellin synthesis FlgM [Paracidovorax wautersii]